MASTKRRWKATDAPIELVLIDKFRGPFDSVFEDSLVKLMEYVRSDAGMYVSIRKITPKRAHHIAGNVEVLTRSSVRVRASVALGFLAGATKDIQRPQGISRCTWLRSLEKLLWYLALGASPRLCTGHQTLLWIICDVGSEDWVHSLNLTIARGNVDAFLACLDQWLQDCAYRHME